MPEFFDRDLAGILLAAALGLLIGSEREWAPGKPIGMRSFALVGMAGGLCAVLAAAHGSWILAAGLLSVATLVGVRLIARRSSREDLAEERGITTGAAALVTFLIGAMAASSEWLPAVVLAGVVTLLLHWKRPLHATIERVGAQDFEIIARFVLIALVVLPVLPNRTYDPYDAFNPFQSWLLVVLIVGMNLSGYLAFRMAGTASGAWLGGVIGGMISSTATTLSYSGLSRRQRGLGCAVALVIIVASTVVYPRVLIEISLISPLLLRAAAGPAGVYALFLVAVALTMSRWARHATMALPEQSNPARFGLAVGFAAIYVVILFGVSIAKDLLGDEAIYFVAVVSGLTDVDALTISVAQLHGRGGIPDDVAWRAVFLATLSNLVFKVGAAAVLGSAELRRWALGAGSVAFAGGLLIILLWP